MNKAKFDECVKQLGAPAEWHNNDVDYVAWWPPVFDRKASDCVYGNAKGSFTQETLNRIECNIEYVSEYFDRVHISYAVLLERDAAWKRAEYLRFVALGRICDNLVKIRQNDCKVLYPTTPGVARFEALSLPTFGAVNDWERIALDLKQLLDSVSTITRKLGTFALGGSYLKQTIRRR